MNFYMVQEALAKKLLLLVVIMLLTSRSIPAQDQQWLLGDWDGQRPALAEKGFDFEFILTLEGVQNVDGGIARSGRVLTNLDLLMDAGVAVHFFHDLVSFGLICRFRYWGLFIYGCL